MTKREERRMIKRHEKNVLDRKKAETKHMLLAHSCENCKHSYDKGKICTHKLMRKKFDSKETEVCRYWKTKSKSDLT